MAVATMLNKNGIAIGLLNANGQAVVFSPELGVVAPTFASEIKGINASGDIVGTTFLGKAFVSVSPYDAFIDLSGLFPSSFNSGRRYKRPGRHHR
jgi:hypothetical protein